MLQGHILILNIFRLLFVMILLWFLSTSYHVWAPDPPMYLQAASFMLSGAKPYIDFIDINPPLIMYLSIIPIFMAKAFSITALSALAIFVVALTFICAVLLQRVMLASNIFSRRERLFIEIMFFVISITIALRVCFAQREHLFVICLLPYLFLRALRDQVSGVIPGAAVVLIGLLCGLMSALKPHFLLTILGVEFFLYLIDKKNYRFKQPEVLCVVAVNIIYGIHFFFLPTDIQKAFFYELVPLVLNHYNAMDAMFWVMWNNSSFLIPVFAFVYGFYFVLRPYLPEPHKKLHLCLIATNVLALAMYVLQNKGWPYQLMVSYMLLFMSLALIGVDFRSQYQNLDKARTVIGVFGATLVLAILFMPLEIAIKNVLGFKNEAYAPDFSEAKFFIRSSMDRILAPGDKVAVLSANASFSYPYIFHKGYLPGTRYLFCFPLAFFNNRFDVDPEAPYSYKALEQMSDGEQLFVLRLQEDIQKNKPKALIFVSSPRGRSYLPKNFDIRKYFEINGSWQKWEQQYELADSKDEIFVYKRKSL